MILTSAVVVMLIVAIVFANNFLNARMAENEFSAVKQFMQTVGLQVDDVAWIIGRTQTLRYASRFGEVKFETLALNYSVFLNDNTVASFFNTTGVLLFNMPIDKYNMGNDYYQRVVPPSSGSFLQKGTSSPVCHVFIVEKVPMNDGNFIRIVVAPSIRMLNTTITTNGTMRNYFKFYLPVLNQTSHPRLSQSITLISNSVSVKTESGVNKIKIRVDFPKELSAGLGNDFFKFANIDEIVNIPSGSVIEFYTSEVTVSLGRHV